jgi:hypothetical protein
MLTRKNKRENHTTTQLYPVYMRSGIVSWVAAWERGSPHSQYVGVGLCQRCRLPHDDSWRSSISPSLALRRQHGQAEPASAGYQQDNVSNERSGVRFEHSGRALA